MERRVPTGVLPVVPHPVLFPAREEMKCPACDSDGLKALEDDGHLITFMCDDCKWVADIPDLHRHWLMEKMKEKTEETIKSLVEKKVNTTRGG